MEVGIRICPSQNGSDKPSIRHAGESPWAAWQRNSRRSGGLRNVDIRPAILKACSEKSKQGISGGRYTHRVAISKESIAKRLVHKALKDIAQLAKPDTILGCYQQLVARKFDGSRGAAIPAARGSHRKWRNW